MSRTPQTFKQSDLTKACKAVMAAGLTPKRAEVDRNGKIVMIFEGAGPSESSNALDQWKAKRDAKAG